MKEKNYVFYRDVLLLWNVFAVLKKNLTLKDLMVMVNKKTTLLVEKDLFSLLRFISWLCFKQAS